MQIRVLLRRLELERLAAESVGPAADRTAMSHLDAEAGHLGVALHAADAHELRRRAEGRGERWG